MITLELMALATVATATQIPLPSVRISVGNTCNKWIQKCIKNTVLRPRMYWSEYRMS